MRKQLFLTFLFATLFRVGYSQNLDKAKLDSYFEALETNNKFMGNIAVTKNDSIVYAVAIGYSDIENKKRADIDTKYRIGSITKTFTAVLIL